MREYAEHLDSDLRAVDTDAPLNEVSEELNKSFIRVATEHITTKAPRPKQPWISESTLGLIHDRALLCSQGRYRDAEGVDKSIKKSARADRKLWFEEKLTKDVWDPA
eukprot:11276194-Alexandrium_andersonii.AAC.1